MLPPGCRDPQPSLAAAVTDRIGRQLVHGQDHFPGPVIGQSPPDWPNQHFGAQNVQHGRAEHQVKEQRDAIPGHFFYRADRPPQRRLAEHHAEPGRRRVRPQYLSSRSLRP